MTQRRLSLILAIAAAALLWACGSTSSPSATTTTPTVRSAGKYIALYQGPLLECMVDYGFANSNLGDEWMVLNVGVAGTQAADQEVRADSISLRTPGGTRIPLPSYEVFAESWGELQGLARRAKIAAQPLDFTRGDRRWSHMSFQPDPGTAAVLTAVHVNYRTGASGLLYFPVPGGYQPGRYALAIELVETEVVVPFELALEQ